MTNSTHLIGIDLEGFQTIIRSVVTSVLQENFSRLKESLKTPSDEYLTRKEAAEFLKISKTTLYTLDKTQLLPAKRLNGKILYLKSNLLTFLNTPA